jgi:hypothetical protein
MFRKGGHRNLVWLEGRRWAVGNVHAVASKDPAWESKVVDDEQIHLLHEALDWALITLHSARSEYRRLSVSDDPLVMIESSELMAARRNLYIAMQTVGEIKRKIRRRNLELEDSPQQMRAHNVFLH